MSLLQGEPRSTHDPMRELVSMINPSIQPPATGQRNGAVVDRVLSIIDRALEVVNSDDDDFFAHQQPMQTRAAQ